MVTMNQEHYSLTNEGGTVTVTTGQTEGGYDFLIIRNGAGEVLYNFRSHWASNYF